MTTENTPSVEGLTALLEKGAEPKPEEGAGTKEVKPESTDQTPPAERTFSKEEWDTRQSKLDTQISQGATALETASTQIGQLQERLDALAADKDSASLASWLQGIKTDGGDVEGANKVVTAAQAVTDKISGIKQMQTDLAKEKREFDSERATVREGARKLAAVDLAKQYELDDAGLKELLDAADPTVMEMTALRLSLKKAKTEAVPVKKVPSGRGEAQGGDTTKGNPVTVLGQLAEAADEASKK